MIHGDLSPFDHGGQNEGRSFYNPFVNPVARPQGWRSLFFFRNSRRQILIKGVVAGIGGRMGRCISAAIDDSDGITLAGGTERKGSEFLGRDAGELTDTGSIGKPVVDDMETAIKEGQGDVIIDFTAPSVTMKNLAVACELKKGIVIGTTGIEENQKEEIKKASENIAIVFAPNMSVGVNLMLRLVREAAAVLGEGYDIEIVEAHHRHKKDAPSGTAMKLAEVLAEATQRDLNKVGVFSRKGIIGERKKGEIGVQTIRAGDIVGDHTVYFGGIGERIEITHRASSRDTFARGAVKAALWMRGKPPGLYSMQDVLGFSS